MKPGDFYVGVISFFAVLVPGAIGAAVLQPLLAGTLNQLIALPEDPVAEWIAFVVAAYTLGHLIFLAGAWLDGPYDLIRKRRNPYGNQSAYQCALRIRDTIIDGTEREAVNTFQWSRAFLTLFFPAAAGDVHALEADSKFFRSLLVVLALCAAAFFWQHKVVEGVVALALVIPCFMRYYERRLKTTTQAYIYMIALHRHGALTHPSKPSNVDATQAPS